jgi:predicted nucleic acid-binding protein
MSVLVDTSIFVDYLRGFEKARGLIQMIKAKAGETEYYISALTEAELLSGRACEDQGAREGVHALMTLCRKENVHNQIAQKAGEFRRKYAVSLADCIIAATAYQLKSKVWTKNIEEFRRIREIKAEEPY